MVIATWVLLDLYVFFLVYVTCMNIIRAHDEGKLNGLLWVLSLPLVIVGLLIDFLHQVTLFNLIFWDWPRDLTVTARLKRHIRDTTFRGHIARFLCVYVLSPFDHTGNHCD